MEERKADNRGLGLNFFFLHLLGHISLELMFFNGYLRDSVRRIENFLGLSIFERDDDSMKLIELYTFTFKD